MEKMFYESEERRKQPPHRLYGLFRRLLDELIGHPRPGYTLEYRGWEPSQEYRKGNTVMYLRSAELEVIATKKIHLLYNSKDPKSVEVFTKVLTNLIKDNCEHYHNQPKWKNPS